MGPNASQRGHTLPLSMVTIYDVNFKFKANPV